MLAGPRMQGPHGSTEAVAINGSMISPLGTWDSKITTVLALAGGIANITSTGLALEAWAGGPGTALARFYDVIGRAYGNAFPFIVGTDAPFAIPDVSVPDSSPDWTSTCPPS